MASSAVKLHFMLNFDDRTSQKPGRPVKNQANWSCWPVEKKVMGNPFDRNLSFFIKFFEIAEWILWTISLEVNESSKNKEPNFGEI